MADKKPEGAIPHDPGLAGTLGKAAEQSREDYHGGGEPGGANEGDRPLGRKDPMTTGQNAPDKHNVPTR